MKEMTEVEAEATAARLPLPVLTPEEMLWHAEDFARQAARRVACMAIGLAPNHLKSEWHRWEKSVRAQLRFERWVRATGATWDRHRHKYMVIVPDNQEGAK